MGPYDDVNTKFLKAFRLTIETRNNNLHELDELLYNNANPNLLVDDDTLLVNCLAYRRYDIFELLIKYESDINGYNPDGKFFYDYTMSNYTPLMYLFKLIIIDPSERARILEWMLTFNPDLELVDERDNNALNLAIMSNNFECVKLLIDAGAKVNSTLSPPLMIVVRYNIINREIIKLLIDNGADRYAKSRRGLTPMMISLLDNNKPMYRLLLELGVLKDATSKQKSELCEYVMYINDPEDAKHFFEILDTFNAINKKYFNKWFTIAVSNVDQVNNYIITQLIINGANVNESINIDGVRICTALHIAVWRANVELVKILLEVNADTNAIDYLCDCPANFKYQSMVYGSTPLHYILYMDTNPHDKNFHIIGNMLLKHGALATIENSKGLTPIDIANDKGNNELLKLLQESIGKRTKCASKKH